jgi:hypothetical protein
MDSKKPSRDLQKILDVFQARGVSAVIDGDTVAVLTVRKQQAADGVRHINYDVHRVRTLTQAYTAAY